MRTGKGSRRCPVPMKANVGSWKVTICPSVMSWAMPRPATIRTRVATMGCTRKRATSRPFQAPATAAAPSAMRAATAKERSCWATAVGRDRPGDGRHRAHREIDTGGGDDQGHPQGDDDDARSVVQDVDGRAVEVTFPKFEIEEGPGAEEVEAQVEEQQPTQGEEGPHRRRKPMLTPPSRASAMRLRIAASSRSRPSISPAACDGPAGPGPDRSSGRSPRARS